MKQSNEMVVRLSQADLDELEALARAASQQRWEVGHSATGTLEDAVAWTERTLAQSDATDLYMVFYGDPAIEGDTRVVALTGNGPTSEANADYLYAVQPQNLLRILAAYRQIQAELTKALE